MKELINKYVWIVDTLTRYERLSRKELNRLWKNSGFSDGRDMPERTFHNYRRGIEENFHVDILCDKQGQYYLSNLTSDKGRGVTNWLMESYAANSALKNPKVPAERISFEDVPSAREFLPMVLGAIADSSKLRFTYAGFTRMLPEKGIVFHPYFVKRYKQRWYMIGKKEKSEGLRTYALDRVKEMVTMGEKFVMPEMTSEPFFSHLIGVTESKGPVYEVKIQTTPMQAKYFRALPFHPSQQEKLHDKFSIFSYKLKLNYELVHELISFGSTLKVLEPPELVAMVTEELERMQNLYATDAIPQ